MGLIEWRHSFLVAAMPKKKVVSPVPADLQPAVDLLIRRALEGLSTHLAAPLSLDEELTEAVQGCQQLSRAVETQDDMTRALARVRPLSEGQRKPAFVAYQLCQRLYRNVTPTTGKILAVPELLGFADLAIQVIVPGNLTLTSTTPFEFGTYGKKLLRHWEEPDGECELQPKQDEVAPVSPAQPPEFEYEVSFIPVKQWWRFVVAPQGSGIASTFQRLQQLRAWAVEHDIKFIESGKHLLPLLRPRHFGVISDDEELCRMAQEQGFRSILVTR